MRGAGRGYYGDEQTERPRKRGVPWFLIGVVGLGGLAWYLKRRRDAKADLAAMPPPVSPADELAHIARLRGFNSVAEYEQSVLAVAREHQAAGGQITLGDHVQHLQPQLEPTVGDLRDPPARLKP